MGYMKFLALAEMPEDFDDEAFDVAWNEDLHDDRDLCLSCNTRVEINTLVKSPVSQEASLFWECRDEMICESCYKERVKMQDAQVRFVGAHRRNKGKIWFHRGPNDELTIKNNGYLPHQQEAKYDKFGRMK